MRSFQEIRQQICSCGDGEKVNQHRFRRIFRSYTPIQAPITYHTSYIGAIVDIIHAPVGTVPDACAPTLPRPNFPHPRVPFVFFVVGRWRYE